MTRVTITHLEGRHLTATDRRNIPLVIEELREQAREPQWPENDCQAAYSILAAMPDATETGKGDARRIEIRRKIAGAGELSDGTRIFSVKPCERWRWLIVDIGWNTIAEIDQRQFFNRPHDLAHEVLKAIESHGRKPQWRTELTPAGEQTVIPGCERNASPKARQLDLFG